jgi:hypothetical protein
VSGPRGTGSVDDSVGEGAREEGDRKRESEETTLGMEEASFKCKSS